MADRDKPVANIKRVDVSNEVNQDPAQYQLKDGRLITFPDIFDMPIEQGEDFLSRLDTVASTGRATPFLKKWLSKDDYEALVAEYDTIRKLKPVLNAVLNYYTEVWGDQGEGSASTS